MKLTKDECRILADSLEDYITENAYPGLSRFYESLNALQERLEKAGKDERRNGRTSLDDYNDCLARYQKNYKKL